MGNVAGLGSSLVPDGVCAVGKDWGRGDCHHCSPLAGAVKGVRPRAPLCLPNVLSQEWEILP